MAEYFINPYTFVPFPKDGNREVISPIRGGQNNEKGDGKSGYIECSMKIESPIFIPNTTKTFVETVSKTDTQGYTTQIKHPKSVFYSYDDLSGKKDNEYTSSNKPAYPVIPGSELRGMVRNVYEQLTNSCMLHIDEKNLPYKRTNEPKNICLMVWKDNNWVIYKNFDYFSGAVRCRRDGSTLYLDEKGWRDKYYDKKNKWKNIKKDFGKALKVFCYGKKNKVQFYDNGDIELDDDGIFYLHIPNMFTSKTNDKYKDPTANKLIIYTDDSEYIHGAGIIVEKNALKRFELVLGIDKGIKGGYDLLETSQMHYYAEHYKNKQPLIVYVDKNSYDSDFNNDNIYMSPACMTKEFFENTIDKLLKTEKNGHHEPCKDIDKVCPACRLFGMVGDDGAVAGKLRFEDGIVKKGPENKVEYGKEITLEILGSPKISSTEFYLEKPTGAKIWNYDYYIDSYGRAADGSTTYSRNSYTPNLRGRKVYWNRDAQSQSAEKTEMNCSVTPITRGEFSFKIYFDGISEKELDNLLFCLKISEKAYHKIGKGKPLGFGKVKLSVDQVRKVEYVKENDKIEKKTEAYIWDANKEEQIKKEYGEAVWYIQKYSEDINEMKLIDYPRNTEEDSQGNYPIFAWFGKNRGSVNRSEIDQTLPAITAVDQKLEKYPKPT